MIPSHYVKGHLDAKGIVTDAPYELVGGFLSMEISNGNSALLRLILHGIDEVVGDKRQDFVCAGNAHEIRINKRSVHIAEMEECVGAPAQSCDIPFKEFHDILLKWQEHLLGG